MDLYRAQVMEGRKNGFIRCSSDGRKDAFDGFIHRSSDGRIDGLMG